MALELVLACEAIAAAVLAPRLGARKTLFVRAGAMGGLAVASEVTKVFGDGLAVLFETCVLSRLAVVAFLMLSACQSGVWLKACSLAARETAPISFKLPPKVDANFETDHTSTLICKV